MYYSRMLTAAAQQTHLCNLFCAMDLWVETLNSRSGPMPYGLQAFIIMRVLHPVCVSFPLF